MNLEKTQLDQISRLLQSSATTSNEIAKISGQDKTTVTLITVGVIMAIAGFLRSLDF